MIEDFTGSGNVSKIRVPWNRGKKGVQIPWNKGKKGLQVPWNKGKRGIFSGKDNPFFGKQHNEESRRKMSEAIKSKWNDPEYQQKMGEVRKGRTTWMKGKHHSDESKKKLSEASKSKWNDPEYRRRILESKKNISDETRRKIGEAGKGRIPWNKGLTGLGTGRKVSEEVKQRISKANKGKKHSEESRRKNSEAVKLAWQNPEYRKRISEFNKGKKLPKETREKISARVKLILENPEMRQKLVERRKYQKFPKSDTIPEKMIQDALRVENIEFTKHKPFKVNRSYHQVDIFIEPNICVEIDGAYWHNRHETKLRDAQIDEALKLQGFQVLRLVSPHKNRDFDVKSCVDKIKETVLKTRTSFFEK